MFKNNKKKLILSSVVILLPIFAGLLLWNRLPEQFATHWGADGNADGYSSKAFGVFGLPVILLAVQWICVWITSKDPKNQGQNNKVVGLVLWIFPILSILMHGLFYSVALGRDININTFMFPFLGLLFVVIGNYLPKCKQNYTIGIKIKWTLANEENWNATHRFCGKVWVIGGLLLILAAFLPESLVLWIFGISLTLLIATPFLYSFLYYKKQVKAGTAPQKAELPLGRAGKLTIALVTPILVILLAAVFVICFTGNIKLRYEDDVFTVEASYWKDLTVEYEAVDAIEYREDGNPGSRVSGFGSPRLSLGTFRNSEFNNYTRYAYTKCDACVVLTVGEKTLVISGKDAAATKTIYEELLLRTGL